MSTKRKRDLFDGFDPNQSDPEDENFDPSEARARPPKKAPRSARSKGARPSRRRRYDGSDIDDDDEEILSDSDAEESYDERDEDEDDEDAPVNAAGRRARKAARKAVTYAEDSEDDDEIIGVSEEEDAKPAKKQQKIVVLRTSRARGKASKEPVSSVGTRRTRAKTEDADEFMELTTSGKHEQPARATSRSKSPETLSRQTRNSRAAKSLKQPTTEPIAEASHETSFQPGENEADAEPQGQGQGQGDDDIVEDSAPEAAAADDQDEIDPTTIQGDVTMGDVDELAAPEDADADEDADDGPITGRRMTRSLRHSISGPAAEEGDGDESDLAAQSRRTTRRSLRSRNDRPKNGDEEASDFEPNESGDGEGSEADGAAGGDEDEDESSEQPSRGRRATTRGNKRTRAAESGDEEEDLDRDELAEEAEELTRASRSRSKRPRRRRLSTPPAITYEDRASRRRAAKVDYTIKMPADPIEQDDDDDAPPPASQRRRNGGTNAPWVRAMNSTFGPFGGAHGTGALLGGAWGSAADAFAGFAGGADSDSSDDEMGARSGLVGVGMTPTTAHAPGGMLGGDNEKLGVGASPNVGKIRDRKALADADPLGVDMTVDFSKVGGLANHINQLKEMVNLPLLYPEVYQRFNMTPPRGVLFHGPPGTGKTLLARALANSIGSGGRKITFYMRKGADALSKWVGEAEKQLRLLFEEARKTQPSIIFFDEIDGLAPVRSSKQEQIHASIVSTLLALMDGMDGRGQVIVIGATNRPDNIDPALRRPGRFDREFYFSLPDVEARKSILDIHTKDWGLADDFKLSLAKNTKGYGGADLRALCTEAALNAIQRTYPQIYTSDVKLVVDPSKINIHATDFMISIKKMIPSSERSATSGASPLPKTVAPLLQDQFDKIVDLLKNILPNNPKITALEEAMYEPYEDADHGFGRENLQQDFDKSRIFRPRLLITGVPGMGQSYIAAAILHHFERVHVQNLDLATVLGDGRPAEQVIVSMFTEVRRHKPSVIYISQIDRWYATLGDVALTALTTMLKTLPPTDPILVLATTEMEVNEMDKVLVRDLFGYSRKNRAEIIRPDGDKRMVYFGNVVSYIRKSPSDFPDPHTRKKRVLEELPVAPPPPPKVKTKEEKLAEQREDRIMLNHLKLRLQPIMDQIKKKYRSFYTPAIGRESIKYLFEESDPNYVSPDIAQQRPFVLSEDKEGTKVITEVATGHSYYNLDIGVIEERISNGFYARPRDFYKDIRTLVHDARNIGDRKMILKANEMESNVDVDVADIEIKEGTAKYEGLHARQVERVRKAEEKAKKKAAMEAAIGMVASSANGQALVQSDVNVQGQANGEDEDNGPIRLGAPVPPEALRTMAHFRVMSPLPGEPQQPEPPVTNGDSVPSRPAQSGTDDTQTTQAHSQMGPPQLPRAGPSQTAGGTQPQQISQVSAVTSLPPGVSPSAVLNEASTTNDPSTTNRSSDNWSTQATNGYHPDMDVDAHLPDTQPPGSHPSGPSQHTGSSNSPWFPSQADAMAHGRLSNLGYSGAQGPTSPTSSQAPTEQRTPATSRMGLPNLLNDTGPSDTSSSIRNSGASTTTTSSQLPIVHEEEIRAFQRELTERTSGCTIEQLEQINRELMDHIWTSKHEWNRMKVLNQLAQIFNETIRDIEEEQGVGQSSQDLLLERTRELYGSN